LGGRQSGKIKRHKYTAAQKAMLHTCAKGKFFLDTCTKAGIEAELVRVPRTKA
jgi:hypothetical protein